MNTGELLKKSIVSAKNNESTYFIGSKTDDSFKMMFDKELETNLRKQILDFYDLW